MTPSKRDRWLALALLAGLLLLAYAVLVHPWWTVPMRELDGRIATLQERELRLRAQIEQAPVVEQRLAQLAERQANRPGFMPEANAELATAALIQRLEAVVAEASPGNRSCAIVNRSPLEPSNRDPYTRVTVQVRLKCGSPETAAVLHALESGSPRLFVGNLNILVQRMYFAPGTGRSSSDGGLDVSFDLYGYLPPGNVGGGGDRGGTPVARGTAPDASRAGRHEPAGDGDRAGRIAVRPLSTKRISLLEARDAG